MDLGTTDAAKLPTDERLKNFDSVNDPQFVTLYYQFGRYLLISSSQPGGQPANLQGIWNNKLYPPWDSKYTININAEMNYWPAEKTNLSELHEPFLQMVKEMSVTGSQTAKDMYGARGWMAHHNTDIWRTTGAVDGAFWGIWNNGGGWSSQHLWEHYQYNGDKNYLASVYPVLKGAAVFYADFLIEHPKYHYLVICPGHVSGKCTACPSGFFHRCRCNDDQSDGVRCVYNGHQGFPHFEYRRRICRYFRKNEVVWRRCISAAGDSFRNGSTMWMTPTIITGIFHIYMVCFLRLRYHHIEHLSYIVQRNKPLFIAAMFQRAGVWDGK